jgi:hypothetical protein
MHFASQPFPSKGREAKEGCRQNGFEEKKHLASISEAEPGSRGVFPFV